jgi:hypothetical protein
LLPKRANDEIFQASLASGFPFTSDCYFLVLLNLTEVVAILNDLSLAGSYQSKPCLPTTSRVAPFCPSNTRVLIVVICLVLSAWRFFPDMDARQCQPSTEGETTMAQRRQRGWLKKESRGHGDTWVLFFRKTRKTDGKRVENKVPIGLVKNLPPVHVQCNVALGIQCLTESSCTP